MCSNRYLVVNGWAPCAAVVALNVALRVNVDEGEEFATPAERAGQEGWGVHGGG